MLLSLRFWGVVIRFVIFVTLEFLMFVVELVSYVIRDPLLHKGFEKHSIRLYKLTTTTTKKRGECVCVWWWWCVY